MRRATFITAGIADPALHASYERCRRLNAQHGRTYYLATLLLPVHKRPFVHALYGFARYADDIVDTHPEDSPAQRRRTLDAVAEEFLADYRRGASSHPVFAATIDTARRWDIPAEHFEAFLDSMRMDLTVTSYDTYDDLCTYMYGSAAVIGLQMVPILGALHPDAYRCAGDLGLAFQLANFIRDVAEDLDRGRVYLPLTELAQFGVSVADLQRRTVTDPLRAALDFQIDRVRRLSAQAAAGVELLSPDARPCIETARVLYCGIVDEIERMDYQVFARRASVPLRRRIAVAAPAWYQARRAGLR